MNEIDSDVALRDCYRCRVCNNNAGSNLIVVKTAKGEYERSNLLTLCEDCKDRFTNIEPCDPKEFVIKAREIYYD